MAWAERKHNSWRVRYRRDDGAIGVISGFPTKKAARDHADDLESGRRKGTWINPRPARPPSPSGSWTGWTLSTGTHAPKRTTAASCAPTSSPGGETPHSAMSPVSKRTPGPSNSAEAGSHPQPLTGSRSCCPCCSPTPPTSD